METTHQTPPSSAKSTLGRLICFTGFFAVIAAAHRFLPQQKLTSFSSTKHSSLRQNLLHQYPDPFAESMLVDPNITQYITRPQNAFFSDDAPSESQSLQQFGVL